MAMLEERLRSVLLPLLLRAPLLLRLVLLAGSMRRTIRFHSDAVRALLMREGVRRLLRE